MYCEKCGNKIEDGSKFCGNCGSDLSSYYNENENVELDDKNMSRVGSLFSKPSKMNFHISKKAIIIGASIVGGLILLAIIAVILYNVIMGPINERNQLVKDCEQALSATKKQQNDLKLKIGGAEYTYNNESRELVTDPSLFDNLNDKISESKDTLNSVCIDEDIPEANQELINKINELNEQKDKLLDSWWWLNDAERKIYNSKNEKSQEAANLVERLNVTGKDNQGYELQTIVRTTGWIKGTDTSLIDNAWKKAGGHMATPTISSFSSKNNGYNDYSNETTAVLIGNAEFHNKTPNFHISQSNKKNPIININIYDINWKNIDYKYDPYKNIKFGFSWVTNYAISPDGNYNSSNIKDEPRYGFLSWNSGKINQMDNDDIVTAEMVNDDWGPVAFMIVAHDVFSPNYPNGLPNLSDINLSFWNYGYQPNSSNINAGTYAYIPKKYW